MECAPSFTLSIKIFSLQYLHSCWFRPGCSRCLSCCWRSRCCWRSYRCLRPWQEFQLFYGVPAVAGVPTVAYIPGECPSCCWCSCYCWVPTVAWQEFQLLWRSCCSWRSYCCLRPWQVSQLLLAFLLSLVFLQWLRLKQGGPAITAVTGVPAVAAPAFAGCSCSLLSCSWLRL